MDFSFRKDELGQRVTSAPESPPLVTPLQSITGVDQNELSFLLHSVSYLAEMGEGHWSEGG